MARERTNPESPLTAAAGAVPNWNRRGLWLLAGVVLVRLIYAAAFPLDLAPDESYYWDWGRRLDIGYYSKPPMIAWLMGLAGRVGNDSIFILKLFPGLLATAGLGCVFLVGRDMYGGRAGWWAVLLLLATPANVALSTFFTIDAPLFLCWSASLWCAWRWWSAVGAKEQRGWALALTVSLGCGYLTKQIQLLFPVLLFATWATTRARPRRGAEARQLVGIAVGSLLFLTPPLFWNWRHGWITFRHTAQELTDTPFAVSRSLKFLGEFLGGQAGLGGGLTWCLMVGALVGVLRRWRTADDRARFLTLLCVPGLACFLALAVHQRVEQNWPMVFYTSAVVLAAGAYASRDRDGARWLQGAVALGGVLALALMAVPFVFPASPWAGSTADPTARIRGWRDFARQMEAMRARVPRPGMTFLMAPEERFVASALAYYLPDHPRTWTWEDPARPESQYGIWGRPWALAGHDALVVTSNPDAALVRDAAASFESWQSWGEIVVRLGVHSARDRRYQVFLGRSLRASGAAGEGAGRGEP